MDSFSFIHNEPKEEPKKKKADEVEPISSNLFLLELFL